MFSPNQHKNTIKPHFQSVLGGAYEKIMGYMKEPSNMKLCMKRAKSQIVLGEGKLIIFINMPIPRAAADVEA